MVFSQIPIRPFAVLCFGLVFAVLAVSTPAKADQNGAIEESIRGVIGGQIAAFRRDDSQAAFAFAAPLIQQRFGSPERFMEMVRRGYRPVYRPAQVDYGPFRQVDNRYEQIVDIIDERGKGWRALYTLIVDETGRLRIASCVLIERPLTGV